MDGSAKKKKVLMVASCGGHLEEIMTLKGLAARYETAMITEKTPYDVYFWQDRHYVMPQVNRHELKSLPSYFQIIWRSFLIIRRENPDVIMSTGAMMSFPVLLIGKLMRKRIVFIEVMSNVDKPTMTGRLVYRFADLFLVQWPQMLKVYPNAVYGGRVF